MSAETDFYGLVVRFELLDGHGDAFDQLTTETVERIKSKEPGTLVYTAHVAAGWPAARIFYELYRNEEAFRAHESTPHVRRFLTERSSHLRNDPEVWRVAPLVGVIREDLGLDGG
jgi:quinol monooxygenase YgiN